MKVRDGAPNISCKRRPAKSEKMNHAHIYILCAPWFIINQDCTVERITVSYLEARRTRGGQTSHERGRRASTRYRLASMEGDEVARAGSTYERSAAMMAWLAERPTLAERTRNRPIIVPRVRTENRGATFDRLGKPWLNVAGNRDLHHRRVANAWKLQPQAIELYKLCSITLCEINLKLKTSW